MDIRPEQYGDQELLQHTQNALDQWKWVESGYEDKDTDMEAQYTVETLKQKYISLLMEVRKRNLSLTHKQLLHTIILSYPSNKG